MDGWMDGWIRALHLFQRISVKSGRWRGENEGFCTMRRRLDNNY